MTTAPLSPQPHADARGPVRVGPAGSQALELLRLGAVLGLTAFHIGLYGVPTRLGGRLAYLAQMGWVGTDALLALAGFLTLLALDRTQGRGARKLGAYLGRRARRVLPAYYAFLLGYLYLLPAAITALAGADALPRALQDRGGAVGAAAPYLWLAAGNLFLARAPIGAAAEGLFAIGVGVQATLLVAPVLAFVRGNRRLWALGAGFLVTLVFRAIAVGQGWADWGHGYGLYAWPLSRADGFILGALAATQLGRPEPRIDRWAGGLCLVATAACLGLAPLTDMLSVHHRLTQTVGFPLISVAASAGVLWLARRKHMPGLLTRVAPLGAAAYGMYFVKLPFVSALSGWLSARGLPATVHALAAALGGLLGTLVLGLLFHALLERPLTRLFTPRRRRAQPDAGEPS